MEKRDCMTKPIENMSYNLDTPLGEYRDTGKTYLVENLSTGNLSNHHHYQATNAVPGVQVGDWLIGDKVTPETATYVGTHAYKIEKL
jgi:hypothetical protein